MRKFWYGQKIRLGKNGKINLGTWYRRPEIETDRRNQYLEEEKINIAHKRGRVKIL